MAEIRDPLAMRAMAHPLRIRLLETLAAEGSATATRCAQLLGESPSNCSFHLRLLAKYGFLEPAAPRSGRERPWQLTSVTQSVRTDYDGPDSVAAVRALDETLLNWELGRIRAALGYTPEQLWRGSRLLGGASMWLTADEARALGEDLTALSQRHLERAANPALRPAGSRPVRLFIALSPILDLDPSPPAASADRSGLDTAEEPS